MEIPWDSNGESEIPKTIISSITTICIAYQLRLWIGFVYVFQTCIYQLYRKFMCKKKLVIGPDFHQKFYQNRVISQKYDDILKSTHFFFDLTLHENMFESYWFIARKSRKESQLSQFITNKSRKNLLAFFQSSRFVASKSWLDAFCQKLSRLIARKSWEKLQWSQFTASKRLKKVQPFRFIFSKARKNCNEFFQSTQFTASTRLLFCEQGGEKSIRFIASKIRKNAISESKIKNVAWNPIHDLSKQLVIKARNLKLWLSTGFSIQILLRNFLYQCSIMIWIQLQGNKKLFLINYIFKSGRPEKHTWSYLFYIRRCPRPGAVTHVNFCLPIMSKFLSSPNRPHHPHLSHITDRPCLGTV